MPADAWANLITTDLTEAMNGNVDAFKNFGSRGGSDFKSGT